MLGEVNDNVGLINSDNNDVAQEYYIVSYDKNQ